MINTQACTYAHTYTYTYIYEYVFALNSINLTFLSVSFGFVPPISDPGIANPKFIIKKSTVKI